jgi:hypothetical protein
MREWSETEWIITTMADLAVCNSTVFCRTELRSVLEPLADYIFELNLLFEHGLAKAKYRIVVPNRCRVSMSIGASTLLRTLEVMPKSSPHINTGLFKNGNELGSVYIEFTQMEVNDFPSILKRGSSLKVQRVT